MAAGAVPPARSRRARLRDGTPVLLRPVLPGDKRMIAEGFARLSPESRYRRFMTPVHELSPHQLAYLTEIDYVDHYALLAALDRPGGLGLGIARYVRLKDDPRIAEPAVAVVDEYQGRGLGSLLLQELGAAARRNGITRFRAYFLADNQAVRALLQSLGAEISSEGPTATSEFDVPLPHRTLLDSPLFDALRAVARGDLSGVRSMIPETVERLREHFPK